MLWFQGFDKHFDDANTDFKIFQDELRSKDQDSTLSQHTLAYVEKLEKVAQVTLMHYLWRISR